ncbi:MAG: DHH family phosphoesterase, partial [Traorella sp.]
GNSEATEKKSRVRVRVMAKAIYDSLKEANSVFVVGHKNMDFDCMGANLLLSRIASGYDKKVYIVSESGGIEPQCDEAMHLFANELKVRHNFINDIEAAKLIKKDDLVFAADFHNPNHCNAPLTLEKASKVILIDHHRRSDQFVDNPLLVYLETSASSVCELVTEFVPYLSRSVTISPQEATIAYLGILIDTNRFKARTGSRTFEACATLRKLGVDPNEAEDLVKEGIHEFEEKNTIMRYEKVIFGNMMIAPVVKKEIVTRTAMSKCADMMLSIKGIEASYVIAYTSDTTVSVSARSKGNVNVQKIMEMMNGGGHFSAAALARENVSVEDIEKELMVTIEKIMKEEMDNESNHVE